MTWRLEITHKTRYQYQEPVYSSYNEVRMIPRSGGNQLLLSSLVNVSPRATLYTYRDYFGTAVTAFDFHRVHDHLEITAESHVEVRNYSGPSSEVSWDFIGSEAIQDDFAEHLMVTPYTTVSADQASEIRDLVRGQSTPIDGLNRAIEWITEHLSYQSGITSVQSSAADALAVGLGVCQDFSHATTAALRASGIPARYVSGYLFPGRDPIVGESSIGESHAWVEVWLGRWIGIDTSNAVERTDQRYVAVAKGRDYSDVPPFKGIYFGGQSSTPFVTVTITRRQ
ncbi:MULTISPECIES: transglutaminase family protein [Acidithrix]|uniref:Transglutaminase-like superfamily protein n=1 Tax=Acidithrix ferrooxidans TaxID=1280514 RepID=A0A0D8HH26_9ACTN|nr:MULTISPECIES: transglutaminase family protein [Acidithrix]KJF17228.1 transglutaminase-like superfamily protein [Acidithrix ferrooxidans]CAG4914168.1 unnamed protein product [Acidithrix sp. C25]